MRGFFARQNFPRAFPLATLIAVSVCFFAEISLFRSVHNRVNKVAPQGIPSSPAGRADAFVSVPVKNGNAAKPTKAHQARLPGESVCRQALGRNCRVSRQDLPGLINFAASVGRNCRCPVSAGKRVTSCPGRCQLASFSAFFLVDGSYCARHDPKKFSAGEEFFGTLDDAEKPGPGRGRGADSGAQENPCTAAGAANRGR